MNNTNISGKWFVLSLNTLTFMFIVGIPMLCMPVLFPEIVHDLKLSLVEIGTVWGLIPLSGLFTALIGGLLIDRFKVRNIMILFSLLAAITGGLRGFSNDLITLAITSFLFGITSTVLIMGIQKSISLWFTGNQLGLAQGIAGTGVAIGFGIGSLISATILSPLVGGWRNVLFVYGAISVVVALLWIFLKGEPARAAGSAISLSFRQKISSVIRIKGIWLLGLICFGYYACIQGVIGYLPLYLRNLGWAAGSADGVVTLYNIAGSLGAIPITLLSDRLHTRKAVMVPLLIITILGVGLISVIDGIALWIIIFILGFIRDGFGALIIAMNFEIEEINSQTAGTALGLMNTVSKPGPFISPPIGNSLAAINPGFPFIIWAGFAAIALLGFSHDNKNKKISA